MHRGLVPAVRTADGGARLDGHERVRDHAVDGVDGLISVAGTKYTTVRAVAQRVVDRGMAKLQRPRVPCRTATHPLPGGSVRDLALTIGGSAARSRRRVAERHDPAPGHRLRIALSRRGGPGAGSAGVAHSPRECLTRHRR